jgi:hypothetical protein
MRKRRIKLTTLGLGDLRAANCAISAWCDRNNFWPVRTLQGGSVQLQLMRTAAQRRSSIPYPAPASAHHGGRCGCIDITVQHEPEPEKTFRGTRTRVARVRAEYPNQLDYSGCCINLDHGPLKQLRIRIRRNASAQRACPHSAANF